MLGELVEGLVFQLRHRLAQVVVADAALENRQRATLRRVQADAERGGIDGRVSQLEHGSASRNRRNEDNAVAGAEGGIHGDIALVDRHAQQVRGKNESGETLLQLGVELGRVARRRSGFDRRAAGLLAQDGEEANLERMSMFAVMLGMDEALEAAGYDDRSYDFGSALHEALTNSLCLMRWMRRQPAFPDSCLADRS